VAEALRSGPQPLAIHPPRIATVERARAAGRGLAIPSVPPHVGTMLGLSMAGYAVAIAAVTGLQAASDAAVIADRAPVARALDQIGAGHDRLAGELDAAGGRYAVAASGYGAVTDRIGSLEASLGALSTAVAGVDGAARALPVSVALPPVVRSVRQASQPAAHATSGGSAKP
jgi:hypothetical protein